MSVKSMTIHSIDLAEDNGLQSHTPTSALNALLEWAFMSSSWLAYYWPGLKNKKKMHSLKCKRRVSLLLRDVCQQTQRGDACGAMLGHVQTSDPLVGVKHNT